MTEKEKQEQVEKLNKLKEKNLPDNIQKSIADKEKKLQKPFNK